MRFLVVCLLMMSFCAHAQELDSTFSQTDTTNASDYVPPPDDAALPDSAKITVRSFDGEIIRQVKADPDLQYEVEATVAETIWDRLWRWITDWISSILDAATTTHWGRVFAYLFLVVAFIVIILMILKVNAFKVFYGEGSSAAGQHVLDENIHEMDFERLIQDALGRQDYRLGIRLLFLYGLKMLADKNHIHWTQGKTNQDYLNELSSGDLKTGFSELNYFFEYAWYGNFAVTDGVYARVRKTFDDWRRKI